MKEKEINDIATNWYDKYVKNPFAVLSFALAFALCVVIYHYRKDTEFLNSEIVKCNIEARQREQQRIKENADTFKELLNVQEKIYTKNMDINKEIKLLKNKTKDK